MVIADHWGKYWAPGGKPCRHPDYRDFTGVPMEVTGLVANGLPGQVGREGGANPPGAGLAPDLPSQVGLLRHSRSP